MNPPIAEPKTIPTRDGSNPFSPASASASLPAASAEEHVALEPARLLRRDDVRHLEVLDLRRDAHGEPGGVERADEVDAALARNGGAPRGRRVVAERRDGSEPGDGDAAHRAILATGRLLRCAYGS